MTLMVKSVEMMAAVLLTSVKVLVLGLIAEPRQFGGARLPNPASGVSKPIRLRAWCCHVSVFLLEGLACFLSQLT